jgi:DNA mismatch repair protein MutH
MNSRLPNTEQELLARVSSLYGKTLDEIANTLNLSVPFDQSKNKGFVGELIELYLGGCKKNKNLPLPDFDNLGIELKTIPVVNDYPTESTHICSASLKRCAGEHWKNSRVFQKLKKVLWVPIQADKKIKLSQRVVGRAFLWSPSEEDESILRKDWEEHVELITLGRFAELHGERGEYLQIRPKGRDSKSRGFSTSELGEPTVTLPRGFYLRQSFTAKIIKYFSSS